jgi:hypothetical protein
MDAIATFGYSRKLAISIAGNGGRVFRSVKFESGPD